MGEEIGAVNCGEGEARLELLLQLEVWEVLEDCRGAKAGRVGNC